MASNINNSPFSKFSTILKRLSGKNRKEAEKQEPIINIPGSQIITDPACQAKDLPGEQALSNNTHTLHVDKQINSYEEYSQKSEPPHSISNSGSPDDDHPDLPNVIGAIPGRQKYGEPVRYPGPIPNLQALADNGKLSPEETRQILDIINEGEGFLYGASREFGFKTERADLKLVTTASELANGLGDIDISDIPGILERNGLKPLGLEDFTKKAQTFLRKAFGFRPRDKAEYLDWRGFFAVALASKKGRKHLLDYGLKKSLERNRKSAIGFYEDNRRAYEKLQAERMEYMAMQRSQENTATPDDSPLHAARPTEQEKPDVSPSSPLEGVQHTTPQAFKTEKDMLNHIESLLDSMLEKAGHGPVEGSISIPVDIDILLQKEELSADETRSILQIIDEKTGNMAYKKAAEYFGFKVAEVNGKVWSTAKELASALGYKDVSNVLRKLHDSFLEPLDITGSDRKSQIKLQGIFSLSPNDRKTKFLDWKCFLAVGWIKQEVKDYFISKETKSRLDTFAYQVSGFDAQNFAKVLEHAKTNEVISQCAKVINSAMKIINRHISNTELNKQIDQPQQEAEQPKEIPMDAQKPPPLWVIKGMKLYGTVTPQERTSILKKYNKTLDEMREIGFAVRKKNG